MLGILGSGTHCGYMIVGMMYAWHTRIRHALLWIYQIVGMMYSWHTRIRHALLWIYQIVGMMYSWHTKIRHTLWIYDCWYDVFWAY